ncbi:hypothetical protein HDV01_000391 [Terramyces sp. JEL0728]|nr:hypothetical protein HDV01_000391 [Terramyces sp. JEL0728]
MHWISLFIGLAHAFPANETCSVDILTNNVNSPSSSLGYAIAQVTNNDGSVELTLNNYSGLSSFTNILLYVTSLTNSSQHLGSFPVIDWTKFHYVQWTICESQGISGQGSATITDSNQGKISLPYTFMFNATADEIASRNNMLVRAVVFSGSSWQKLDPLAIKPAILPPLSLSSQTITQFTYTTKTAGSSGSATVVAALDAGGATFSSAYRESVAFSILISILLFFI